MLDIELVRLEPDKDIQDFAKFLEVAAELGTHHILRQIPDLDLHRVVQKFGRFCEMARQLNMTADLEFRSWTETGNFEPARWVLEQADQPNDGLLIDTLHFVRSIFRIKSSKKFPRDGLTSFSSAMHRRLK